ncbi:hypothetical protein IMZ48_10020, partial [Candidatus Bathyarchaeota archaeon]|nr:hypothetical protein [Candidatus Bathyarchaeota archaeon]
GAKGAKKVRSGRKRKSEAGCEVAAATPASPAHKGRRARAKPADDKKDPKKGSKMVKGR